MSVVLSAPARGLSETLRAFYYTSPMREGLLCWYPFDKDARVLDISGGVLTDWLRRHCGTVTSDPAHRADQFDYIVLLDPVDMSVGVFKQLRAWLSPQGRLLLAYENPFALRYWSGKPAPHTGLSYDTLTGQDGNPGKAEVQTRLTQAGFSGQKWYYPLTDHWFTRELYSDNYLPNEYLNQRFVPYVDADDQLQFSEQALYREVIRGGAFTFMCGAYLVEARTDAAVAPCTVDYAAITAYRDPAKRFATIVCHDGTVRKAPLHPDGRATVLGIQRNHEELARLGVDVVSSVIKDHCLVMPRMELPTLWDYWAGKLSDGTFDENEMFSQFDRIRDAIYRAAQGGKCFWELVPANCFYDTAKDSLLFFDQEYCWEHAPPEMALARALSALRYSAVFKSDPRTALWLERLMAKYGLTDCWDELCAYIDKQTYAEVFGDGDELLRQATSQAARQVGEAARYRKFLPVAQKLAALGFSCPAIYGYGIRGRTLLRALYHRGITVSAVIDRQFRSHETMPQTLLPIKQYGAVGDMPRHTADVLMVSIRDGENITAELREKTDIPVYTTEELLHKRDE